MSLEEQINKDYVRSMKDKDSEKSTALNFLRAQIKNALIEKRPDPLRDTDVIAVIKKQVKQRQDSIEQYQKGGRQELADKEISELALLKEYLPPEMSESQLKDMVEASIQEAQASSIKDMGKVMKMVAAKAEGRADNKMISQLVKNALS